MSASTVLAHTFIALRLPSGVHKVFKVLPDTIISLGKYGAFHSNSLLGRPFYLTFEILDLENEHASSELRIVPASELHAENLVEEEIEANGDSGKDDILHESLEIDRENVETVLRNNMLTVDDPSRQTLTMAEIEELKKEATGSGKDIIARLIQSHSALDEKTTFSLAKYTLRKSKKYLRRFTLLPLDVSMLAQWMLAEKEPARIMEIREEVLGLIASWSNIHCVHGNPLSSAADGRWLAVDDTGGLIVAALAERMEILHPIGPEDANSNLQDEELFGITEPAHDNESPRDGKMNPLADEPTEPSSHPQSAETPRPRRRQRRHAPDAMSATSNTVTLIHAATQPNISMLSYFSYSPNETSASEPYPASKHPLHTHLKTVNWLQLLSPHLDGAYVEPEAVEDDVVATWKTSKRSNYFRKRRRWECTKRVVDETRDGGFDGLVIASPMDLTSVLHYLVPLLKGGAQVVVYSPNVEPLAELMDVYSSARKSALLNLQRDEGAAVENLVPTADFPLDPRLLLAPSLQTARAREWQVLPGRTHPLMTGRGGPEGYLFTATRVLPVEGGVEARGKFTKKRKMADGPISNGTVPEGLYN